MEATLEGVEQPAVWGNSNRQQNLFQLPSFLFIILHMNLGTGTGNCPSPAHGFRVPNPKCHRDVMRHRHPVSEPSK